eukprot:gene52417-70098_t
MGRWIRSEAKETEGATPTQRVSTTSLTSAVPSPPPSRREAASRHLPIRQAANGEETGSTMQRLILPERPDWQAKADSLGFTWHHTSGDPYWSDNVAYGLTLKEVEEGIEAPTAE